MNRAGLKMRLFYSHKCRCNSCGAWTGQTYSSAHCRITWPCTGIISSSLILIKFAIASRIGWRIWPWAMSWGCPATCSAAAGWLVGAQISTITHPAGFSRLLCSSLWSCTHVPHAPTTWGCTPCSHMAGGSFLLPSMLARATWLSQCRQGSKKAKRQQWARCWWDHAVSSVPLPTEQCRGSANFAQKTLHNVAPASQIPIQDKKQFCKMLQQKLVLFPARGRAPPCLQHACAAAWEPAARPAGVTGCASTSVRAYSCVSSPASSLLMLWCQAAAAWKIIWMNFKRSLKSWQLDLWSLLWERVGDAALYNRGASDQGKTSVMAISD